jgi:DNA-binding HxlR family transcriptional regulator
MGYLLTWGDRTLMLFYSFRRLFSSNQIISGTHAKTTSKNEVDAPGDLRYREYIVRGYGQFCPVAQAAQVITERWTPLVIRELLSGSHRFNEIQRGVPLMSPALLAKRLKTLELYGIIERRSLAGGSSTHEYHLTQAGEELRPWVELMGTWGQRWVRRPVSPQEADPGFLMWEMRRSIDLERLPDERVVVRFVFQGALKGKRSWWLILERPEPDVCVRDLGFEVSLTVRTEVVTMASVWVGDLDLAGAIRSRLIVLEGPSHLRRAFPSWLMLNQFNEIKSAH